MSMSAAMAFSGTTPSRFRNRHEARSSMAHSLHRYDERVDDRHLTGHHSLESRHAYDRLYPSRHRHHHRDHDDDNYYGQGRF